MEIRYERYVGLPPEPLLASLLDLLAGVFGNQPQSEFLSELSYQFSRNRGLTLLSLDHEQVVGCKLGYERKPGHFYSWLGGVHTAYRGRGIAGELMHQQYDWCRQQNYQTVRTQTYNQWRTMLILNLRAGFDIIGTQQGKHGLMIILEKRL